MRRTKTVSPSFKGPLYFFRHDVGSQSKHLVKHLYGLVAASCAFSRAASSAKDDSAFVETIQRHLMHCCARADSAATPS